MALPKMLLCLLVLCLPHAICQAANEENFSTDWITPSLETIATANDVCAIDLTIRPHGEGWSGTVTLYSGQPIYDAFGDADKKLLHATTLPVQFRKSKAQQTLSASEQQHLRHSLHYVADGDSGLALLSLVLNFEQPGECRLLIEAVEGGHTQRVLSLRSERRQLQASQYPKCDVSSLNLESDLFIGSKNQFNLIQIVRTDNKANWTQDENSFGLNEFGEVSGSTLVRYLPQKLSLTDMQFPDLSGQKRRVIKCELNGIEVFLGASKRNTPANSEPHFLVLDLHEGGWHRLLLMKEGKLHRIVPISSRRFRAWIKLKSQIEDRKEKEIFDELSKELPWFSGFKLENNLVVGAVMYLSPETERVLEHLVGLPNLRSLEIHGIVEKGEPIERMSKLEGIHFSHGSITEEVLQHLGRNRNLKEVFLYSVRLDCRGLKQLAGLRELTSFGFWNGEQGDFAQNFEDSCVDVFSSWPKLQYLNLHAMPLTEAAVKRLPVSSELQRVLFSENVPTKALLRFAMGNPQAEIATGGTQSCLAKGILRLPVSVTDSDLGELESVRNLNSLDLGGTKLITDEGLAKLASLKLKHLSLMHNGNITDAGVVHLSKIKSLESLNLWYCKNLTNRSVEAFKQLPNLRKINFFGTNIDWEFFQKEIPNCVVER